MKYLFALLLAASCLAGCRGNPDTPDDPSTQANAQGPPGAPGSGGITPMTPTPIPNAPVAGTDSVTGSGSGVGSVMKGRARDMAAQGPSSINQAQPDDDDGAIDDGGGQ